jgi:hypothetical protein
MSIILSTSGALTSSNSPLVFSTSLESRCGLCFVRYIHLILLCVVTQVFMIVYRRTFDLFVNRAVLRDWYFAYSSYLYYTMVVNEADPIR